jgi:hypothetical protein
MRVCECECVCVCLYVCVSVQTHLMSPPQLSRSQFKMEGFEIDDFLDQYLSVQSEQKAKCTMVQKLNLIFQCLPLIRITLG